ncbi:MAG: NAD(P)H-dependent oxidoreductase [Hyphomonas sp.]|uniref:NADPH-dependent FMN reductase n=1 Tax=Hyphomonas sp. TaxID=87 RepID=UPI00329986E8
MLTIGIITGSTRPGRKSHLIAKGVAHAARENCGDRATFNVLDIADFDLPMLDEPVPAIMGDYRHAHTKTWAKAVDACDGFIFVTPEYNHSIPGALKNAIDFLYSEWSDKAAGFVSYGGSGGVRAVEQLRLILAETRTATVRSQVLMTSQTSKALFTAPEAWVGGDRAVDALVETLIQVLDWSEALKTLRLRQAASFSEDITAS